MISSVMVPDVTAKYPPRAPSPTGAGPSIALLLLDMGEFAAKIPDPRRCGPHQHPLAVLGAPYQVNLEVVLCVTAESISSHSATSSTVLFA